MLLDGHPQILHLSAEILRILPHLVADLQQGTWIGEHLWDKQTPRETDRGLVLEHNPGPEHGTVQLRVVERVPDRRVEWECISTHPASSPASAWTGTHFIWEITKQGDRAAVVDFRQTNYNDRSLFFSSNRDAWWQVLQNLKRVIESSPPR